MSDFPKWVFIKTYRVPSATLELPPVTRQRKALSDDEKRAIKELRAAGWEVGDMSRIYRVSLPEISAVVRGIKPRRCRSPIDV